MTGRVPVVIGVGNEFRRDDGAGPVVLAALERRGVPGVELALSDGEPTQLFDLWAQRPLAVVVDAVRCEPSTPGRVHRTTLTGALPLTGGSTHGLGIPDAIRLAQVLGRAPERLVVFAVEAAELGFGLGLTEPVARAVPEVIAAVLAELGYAPLMA